MKLPGFAPASLGRLWACVAGLLAFCPLLLSPYFGLPAPGWWLGSGAFGLVWGLWLRYRARLGNPLQVAAFLLLIKLVYLSWALGCVGMLLALTLERPDLLGEGAILMLASLGLPWLIGLLQAIDRMRREGIHMHAAWLRSLVDLARWAMRADGPLERRRERFMDRIGWPSLGLLLMFYVLLQFVGLAEDYGMYVLVPVMLAIGWAGALPGGRALAYLIGLHRFEKLSGRHLLAAHQDALDELRRGFWGSRWLCSPLPPAPPAPPAPPPRGSRGGRAARRGRR